MMTDNRSGTDPWTRRPQGALVHLATDLFAAAGMEAEKAACMARLLVLTDMMGRHTHGLAQCEPYLRQIAQGDMATAGGPEILRDTGGTIVLCGRPGSGNTFLPFTARFALAQNHTHQSFSNIEANARASTFGITCVKRNLPKLNIPGSQLALSRAGVPIFIHGNVVAFEIC